MNFKLKLLMKMIIHVTGSSAAYVWVPDKHERLLAPGRNITTLKKKRIVKGLVRWDLMKPMSHTFYVSARTRINTPIKTI